MYMMCMCMCMYKGARDNWGGNEACHTGGASDTHGERLRGMHVYVCVHMHMHQYVYVTVMKLVPQTLMEQDSQTYAFVCLYTCINMCV